MGILPGMPMARFRSVFEIPLEVESPCVAAALVAAAEMELVAVLETFPFCVGVPLERVGVTEVIKVDFVVDDVCNSS